MRIGEFAKACQTESSLLRHYDNIDLLKPVRTGAAGYREYGQNQVTVFREINELKAAGFSLSEIKTVIDQDTAQEKIVALFSEKEQQIKETLRRLGELWGRIEGGTFMEQEKLEYWQENVHIPFEDDERVVGKWEVLVKYESREEFEAKHIGPKSDRDRRNWFLYFLPKGAWYCEYGWTKGKLLYRDCCTSSVNDYTLEERQDGLYMYIEAKDYDYAQNGKINLMVLRQCDKRHYSALEVAITDEIDLPFENDERVLGTWSVFDCGWKKDEFVPGKRNCDPDDLHFKELSFLPEGDFTYTDSYDGEVSGRKYVEWTKGYVLHKEYESACPYEIGEIEGAEYLFLEWRCGNYLTGNGDVSYYVFKRKTI